MQSISESFGEGIYEIAGVAVICGEDVSFSFTGGTQPHIGAVSIAVYEPVRDSATVSTVTVYEHRDDQLSAKCAKDAAIALKCTAAVSVGIHMDDAAPEDITILINNFKECYRMMAEKIIRNNNRERWYTNGII